MVPEESRRALHRQNTHSNTAEDRIKSPNTESIVAEGPRKRTLHKQDADSNTAEDMKKSPNTEESKKDEHKPKTYGRTSDGTGM